MDIPNFNMPQDKPKVQWYQKTSTFVIALLCVGPLALPLLWFNPRFNLKMKIIISLVIIVLSYYSAEVVYSYFQMINQHYKDLFQQLLELK